MTTLRREDARILAAGGRYVSNLPFEGLAHVAYVRSPLASARVRSIDTAAARALPGVLGVFTAEDLDLPPVPPERPMMNQAMVRPMLAEAVVRFVGEMVAVVVAEDAGIAEDAVSLVVVDYEPLPALVDPEEAVRSEVLVHEDAGTNVVLTLGRPEPGDDFFDGCDVVVRQRVRAQRLAPSPMEGRAVVAAWDAGRLTYHISTQKPHVIRDELTRTYGLAPDRVRVVVPDVGGAFGPKCGGYPDELLLGWVARAVGRPVRWVETRSEAMTAMGHGRGQVLDVELGGTRDGTLLAYRLRILQDAGAYPRLGAWLPALTRLMTTGVYRIPKAACWATSVLTNTTPVTAYRGAGRPEAADAIERAVDLFAADIGMDPAELRRRNLLQPADFPYVTPTGAVYDSGDYPRALQTLLDVSDYDGLRAAQADERAASRGEPGPAVRTGIGLATFVEVTNAAPFPEFASVRLAPDASIVVSTGSSPHGQSHETVYTALAAERLGVDPAGIGFVSGDTDRVPRGAGTFSSRSGQLGAVAVTMAADRLVEVARPHAARLLACAPPDVSFDATEGCFAAPSGRQVSWGDLARATAGAGGLHASADFHADPTYAYGAYLAVVDVDTETGQVRCRRIIAVDDAGTVLNPVVYTGQVHGGIAQGVAQALYEEITFDDGGNPTSATFADYGIVSAAELPSYETFHQEVASPNNPLGVKGVGESGTIGAAVSVHNAVLDVLGAFGVRHLDTPLTAEKVWRAVHGG